MAQIGYVLLALLSGLMLFFVVSVLVRYALRDRERSSHLTRLGLSFRTLAKGELPPGDEHTSMLVSKGFTGRTDGWKLASFEEKLSVSREV